MVATTNSSTQRVLSGIRATGRLHLGNYFGAVKGMIELQDDPRYDTFYMVADVHSVTTPWEPESLKVHRREVILDYLAAGLDPEKSTLFLQSLVPQHTELAFLFSALTTVAKMQHLPTFKDKVKQHPESATMALLNYPVLMAADILLYHGELVPVGKDQEPHIEVTREIARRMNNEFGLDFPEPESFSVASGAYVPSLTGEGKMSKSVPGSAIDMTDDFETIKDHLAKTPTDSGSGDSVPETGGVATLLTLVELFQGVERRKEYEKAYTTDMLRYQPLKDELAEAIAAELEPYQERRAAMAADPDYVDYVIKTGAEKAREVAQETVDIVKERMGLGSWR